MKVCSKAMLLCAGMLLIVDNFLDQCKFIHQNVASTAKIVIVGADFTYCPLFVCLLVIGDVTIVTSTGDSVWAGAFCPLLERKGFRH